MFFSRELTLMVLVTTLMVATSAATYDCRIISGEGHKKHAQKSGHYRSERQENSQIPDPEIFCLPGSIWNSKLKECKCVPELCHEPELPCPAGFEYEKFIEKTGEASFCCDFFICVKIKSKLYCPPGSIMNSKSNECECEPTLCPKQQCNVGFKPEKIMDKTGKPPFCCDSYSCLENIPKFPKSEEMRKKIKKTLKQVNGFKNLQPKKLADVADAMEEVKVKAGDTIIRIGDFGEYFYIIGSGTFEVFVPNDDGSESLKRTYNNDGSFGEKAMTGYPRSATVRAKTDGILFKLGRKLFFKLMEPLAASYAGIQ